MKKFLHKIFLLTFIFICNAINQSNATQITNNTDKVILVKIFYDQNECHKLVHFGTNSNFNKEFLCPTIKIGPNESKNITFPDNLIKNIVIEIILQKNQRLCFPFKTSPFKDYNVYFLILHADPKTTFQLDCDEYGFSTTTWTLKISTDSEGREGSFKTTTPEEISNSY